MLQKEREESQHSTFKVESLKKEIEEVTKELKAIEEEINKSEEFKKEDQERDQYIKIRSQLEQDNAQIMR